MWSRCSYEARYAGQFPNTLTLQSCEKFGELLASLFQFDTNRPVHNAAFLEQTVLNNYSYVCRTLAVFHKIYASCQPAKWSQPFGLSQLAGTRKSNTPSDPNEAYHVHPVPLAVELGDAHVASRRVCRGRHLHPAVHSLQWREGSTGIVRIGPDRGLVQ